MNTPIHSRTVTMARWSARILSILLLSLMAILIVGHIGGGCRPPNDPVVQTANPEHLRETMLGVALFTILAGLALAWKWEGLGALLILGGFTAFAIINGSTRTLEPYPLHNPFFGFLITGLLFLFCWWRTQKNGKQTTPQTPEPPASE